MPAPKKKDSWPGSDPSGVLDPYGIAKKLRPLSDAFSKPKPDTTQPMTITPGGTEPYRQRKRKY